MLKLNCLNFHIVHLQKKKRFILVIDTSKTNFKYKYFFIILESESLFLTLTAGSINELLKLPLCKASFLKKSPLK
jgi:hypothetical protein